MAKNRDLFLTPFHTSLFLFFLFSFSFSFSVLFLTFFFLVFVLLVRMKLFLVVCLLGSILMVQGFGFEWKKGFDFVSTIYSHIV